MKDTFKHRVKILRSGDLGEGLAAAVAYGDARETEAALRDMDAALTRVRTGIVILASEAADTPAGHVDPGHAVGIAEGAIVEVGDSVVSVACTVGRTLALGVRDLLTVLCGKDVTAEEREQLRAKLTEELPDTTIEIHDGGQPLHRYVMVAE